MLSKGQLLAHLCQLDKLDFLSLEFGINIKHEVSEVGSIGIEMSLLKDIKLNIVEVLLLGIPDLWLVVSRWQENSDELSDVSDLLVVDGDQNFFLVLVHFNWAIVDGVILRSSALSNLAGVSFESKLAFK